MMRAETYDELAQLEQLLDDYARLEALDPPKLPALGDAHLDGASHEAEPAPRPRHLASAARRLRRADRARRRLPVRGQGPPGPRRPARARPRARGRAAARAGQRHARLGRATCPGCGGRWRRRTGSTSRRWWRRRARPARRCRRRCSSASRVRRPATATRSTGSRRRRRRCWPSSRRGTGRSTAWSRPCSACRTTASSARCASPPPRSCRASSARPTRSPPLSAALHGRHVPAGPSGSPHPRARSTCCRPGRNFYSVDPRALPSELPTRRGAKLADALLERHQRDAGELPETVGLVAWGTAAMRTAGRRRGRDPRAARRAPALAPGDAPGHRARGDPAGGARPPADRRHACASRASSATPSRTSCDLLDDAVTLVAGARRAARGQLRRRARARRRRALAVELGDGDWRRATARIFGSKPGHLRGRASSSSSTPATGATTPTSPRSTRPGAATPTAAGWTARAAREAMRAVLRAHRRRGQERRHARARPPRLRRLLRRPRRDDRLRSARLRGAEPARVPRRLVGPVARGQRARWPRRPGACSAPAWPTRAGSRR